jgi:hypothetical protein
MLISENVKGVNLINEKLRNCSLRTGTKLKWEGGGSGDNISAKLSGAIASSLENKALRNRDSSVGIATRLRVG